jgi:hypothetical protein
VQRVEGMGFTFLDPGLGLFLDRFLERFARFIKRQSGGTIFKVEESLQYCSLTKEQGFVQLDCVNPRHFEKQRFPILLDYILTNRLVNL